MGLTLSAKAYVAFARRFRGRDTVAVSEILAQPLRILVALSHGGDDLSVLSSLRGRFPESRFVLLLPEEKLWQVRDKVNGKVETLTYSLQARKLLGKEHRDLVHALRAEAFDLGVTTEDGAVALSDILLLRSRARLRVGKRREGCYPFLNCLVDSLEEFFKKGLGR